MCCGGYAEYGSKTSKFRGGGCQKKFCTHTLDRGRVFYSFQVVIVLCREVAKISCASKLDAFNQMVVIKKATGGKIPG
jgi:hypothetical protein